METKPKAEVIVIPATKPLNKLEATESVKLRVAAYARVSTNSEEQLSSYEAQVKYYTNSIKSNPDYIFVKVYTDEGISATNTKKRDGFNDMVETALSGKIDLIVTKSVSRFARNTIDSLSTIRTLKDKGVDVFFEEQNIHTLDAKGELLITIMSSIAQEESRSISENVTWGMRRHMANGDYAMSYKRFLGYEKGEDGKPAINEEQAAVVRDIYEQCLMGRSTREIGDDLTQRGVLTPTGKSNWSSSTIHSILQNEKYAGNAILQKSYTVDFLTKKQKTNTGELPQYFVPNKHPAIVSQEVFDMVQDELQRRRELGKRLSSNQLFAGRIICGECGEHFTKHQWHPNTKYAKTVWQCKNKYNRLSKCSSPSFTEDEIKSAFLKAWNKLVEKKRVYVGEYRIMAAALTNMKEQEVEELELLAECKEINARIDICIQENTRSLRDQATYQKIYDELVAKFEGCKVRLEDVRRDKADKKARKLKIEAFKKLLENAEHEETFSETLWRSSMDYLSVQQGELFFHFKSGTVIQVHLG